jgi:hypothetical protein
LNCKHNKEASELSKREAKKLVTSGVQISTYFSDFGKAHEWVLKFIVLTYQPISLVGNHQFRGLCKALCPNFKDISRENITSRLGNVATILKEKIKVKLAKRMLDHNWR